MSDFSNLKIQVIDKNSSTDVLKVNSDGSINVRNNTSIFTRPFDRLIVLTKTDEGEPLTIKSQLGGVDIQLATILYDVDGDFQGLEITDY